MKTLRRLMSRFGIMGELLTFLWTNKMWWMIPMVVVLFLLGILIVLAQNPVLAPFIYTLF